MSEPTNPNPRVNQDSTTSQTTNDPKTWAAPKDGDGDGFVKLRSDDLHPERVERLGQYLADHSAGRIEGPDNDNSNDRGSHFPIEDPDPVEYVPFGNPGQAYTDLKEEAAKYYFENLRTVNFEPGTGGWEGGARENAPRVQDGHSILDDGPDIVEAHMEAAKLDVSSPWAGIGVERFPPDAASPKYQLYRASENLRSTPVEQSTMGSRFKSFEHLSGQTNADTISSTTFWDDYFSKMSEVGARITLGATGHLNADEARDLGNSGSVRGGGGVAGHPEGLDALEGNYKRVELDPMNPKKVFEQDFSGIDMSEAQSFNGASYGQLYSWADPYEKAQFIGSNRALTAAGQLLEIWAMVQLRVLVVTSIFQAASMILSHLQAHPLIGRKDFMKVPWNRNYYPYDVQQQPGNAFMKGQSGFNHSPVDILERAMEEINEISANVDNYVGFLVPQLAGGVVNQASIILEEEYLNFTRGVLKEINIYIPRHTLSTSANVSGYNDEGNPLNFLLKSVDVATAYTRATAAGLGTLGAHIIGGDYGQSLGFWRNLFRNVVRSKALLADIETHSESSSAYESVLRYVGKDDKIMRFVNYLAMIGDMDIGRGFAGKLAFPENKVVLDQVSNFPTLRTATYRQKGGPNEGTIQSRLSLTETPSLYLLPKSINNIRLGLEDYGVDPMGTVWGTTGKLNNLANTVISEEDAKANVGTDAPINQRFQARATNRFTADQVRRIEDQLEAEHMPFYIQDLRTNEIISFHAFLLSLEDSYSAEWSAQKGFGRMEAAQIYGGGSRSIGVSFMMVPMNEEDFDEMWWKVNKLTTLVYPQWSEGTTISSNNGTFVQPFSQVPTASPLCRIRVGDLFTSNYSKQNMARMMGIGKPKFTYNDPDGVMRRNNEVPVPNTGGETEKYYVRRGMLRRFISNCSQVYINETLTAYDENPKSFELEWDKSEGMAILTIPGTINPSTLSGKWRMFEAPKERKFLRKAIAYTVYEPEEGGLNLPIDLGGTPEPGPAISDLFSSKNPIIKSFESTMGRGIAVAINSIGFAWKLNEVPWELKPGHRAPRMCEVSLGIIPIHDITPGIDHEGFNRAPLYKVGKTSKSFTGDTWYDNAEYEKLVGGIQQQHDDALEGREKEEE